jgi:hypothetical protein
MLDAILTIVLVSILLISFMQPFRDLDKKIAEGLLCLLWSGAFLIGVAQGQTGFSVVAGAIAILHGYLWWKNWRNGGGKKAALELGAKSWARVQNLIDNMKPSPLPSPARS